MSAGSSDSECARASLANAFGPRRKDARTSPCRLNRWSVMAGRLSRRCDRSGSRRSSAGHLAARCCHQDAVPQSDLVGSRGADPGLLEDLLHHQIKHALDDRSVVESAPAVTVERRPVQLVEPDLAYVAVEFEEQIRCQGRPAEGDRFLPLQFRQFVPQRSPQLRVQPLAAWG